MEAIERYIERLGDPAILAWWWKVFRIDEDEAQVGGPVVTEDEVAEAEEALGFSLPPSYRKLVLTTRPDWGPNNTVVWVGDRAGTGPDIVASREGESGIVPPFLIIVVDHEDGNFDCFDTRRPDARGEYPIVLFDHEKHDEDSEDFETVAADLGEYLLASLGGETAVPGEE